MAAPKTTPPTSPVPPLKDGDRLSREEFERRYDAMPELKKAELIEGVVHMPSPVRWNQHARPHVNVTTWLGTYEATTPGVQAGENGTIRLDMENEPQPDAALIVDPACGGRVQPSGDDYSEGAPELVVEVAASSIPFDLGTKLRIYRRNGVLEYLVWRVPDQAIDWFVLRGNAYEPLSPRGAGIYQSETFPGLWLDPAAMARLDLGAVLQVLQQGLASPEHATFVRQLQQRAAGS